MLFSLVLLLDIFVLAQSVAPRTAGTPLILRLEDVSKQAGLIVPHVSTPDKRYIIESMSGGVGFIDCDNSGELSIIASYLSQKRSAFALWVGRTDYD